MIETEGSFYRLPDHLSIFTAELFAIKMAIEKISLYLPGKFAIFCDSLSVLMALRSAKMSHYLIGEILNQISNMVDYNFLFVWCPGHSGIKQNDLVDILAKSGTALNHITNIKESLVERNTKVRRDCMKRWQREWDEVSVLLHDLKPILGRWVCSSRNNRREEVVLCRMRLDTCLFSVKHHFFGSA